MQIERTENEIIIRLPASIDTEDLQDFLNYMRYKELTSGFTVPQEEVYQLAAEINKNRLSFSDFSFSESRKALENYKGSLSDTVIEERRTEL